MRQLHQHTVLILLTLALTHPAQPAGQQATIPSLGDKPVRFTARATEGNPVNRARVEASRHGPGNASGFTGEDGQLTLVLTKGASLHVSVSKTGYYPSSGELWQGGMVKGPDRLLVAREVPDSFEIEIKEIRDPVPLIHRRYRGRAPVTDSPVGFDLEAGDWVRPHGSGESVDILFHFHDIRVTTGEAEGVLTVSFHHPKDGIRELAAARPFSMDFGSNLAPPHKAPLQGYRPALSLDYHASGMETPASSRKNYLFRVRSRTDAGGQLRQACYGWIEGEFRFDPRDPAGPQLEFAYQFNPDPDPEARSLEGVHLLRD